MVTFVNSPAWEKLKPTPLHCGREAGLERKGDYRWDNEKKICNNVIIM